MRIFKSHPLLKLVNSYLVDSPQPSNLSYLWNFGSLLALCLIIQIITGVTLAMHYNPSVLEAFNSIEHIMRDVNNGWLIRYLHSNTASAFFLIVYLHIGRGLYYGSYRAPRTLVWILGTVIFLLMIITGFLGYVLPFGQMSLWGATVITNLMSAIPWIGQDIVEFLWGGFSVNNATLNRFFALHFVLPFVLAALALMHLIVLHDSAGSGNPIGISANYDRLPFAPYFIFKDLITIFIFIIGLSVFVFFMPNVLGDSDNYIMANPMQTPSAIVPEWYLLPFYAILRSIPNKLLGVIAMLSAILVLLAIPYIDLGRIRGLQFRPLSKIAFFIFVGNFLILIVLGTKHVESPFIEFGQISTFIYFAHFLFMIPLSLFENTLIELHIHNNSNVRVKYNLGKSSSKLGNSLQIRSFSTTRSRKVDPFILAGLSIKAINPSAGLGILPWVLYTTCVASLGLIYVCRDMVCDYSAFSVIGRDLIANVEPSSFQISFLSNYKSEMNNLLDLIESKLSTSSIESVESLYTVLQQNLSVNEYMYNHLTTNLKTLADDTGVHLDMDYYHDVRIISNRTIFLIRKVEDILTLNNWITNRLPVFWFET